MNTLFTIGFTKKTAKQFFQLLKKNKIDLIADVRLNNTNQLAGFTRKADLDYFSSIHGIRYEHWLQFAPDDEIRSNWLKTGDWNRYYKGYLSLLKKRKALESVNSEIFTRNVVLLCAESEAEHCHRKIAAEELKKKFRIDSIVHL